MQSERKKNAYVRYDSIGDVTVVVPVVDVMARGVVEAIRAHTAYG